jgi:hypothetical protein
MLCAEWKEEVEGGSRCRKKYQFSFIDIPLFYHVAAAL